MANKKQNDCVVHINEDWYKADKYITYAHKVTARAYWVFIIFVIALACNIIGLFNHYFSTRSHFSKYEGPIGGWCKLMQNENLYINFLDTTIANKDGEWQFKFAYSKLDNRKTDYLNFVTYDEKQKILSFNTVLDPSKEIGGSIDFKKYKRINIDFKGKDKNKDTCIITVKEKDFDYYYPIPINPMFVNTAQEEEFTKQSLKLEYINIPIIGITISVEDFFLIMSFTFFLLSWFLKYTIKAENLTTGKILTIFNKKSIELKELIFYGIVFNNLFFPTTQRKKPYDKLTESEKILANIVNDMPDKSSPKFRNSLNWIYFVPTIVCGINLIMYVVGVVSFNLTGTFLWYFIIIGLIGFLCGSGVFIYNKKTYKFQKGTNKILHNFKQCFKHDYDIIKNIKGSDFVEKEKEMVVAKVNSDVIYDKKYSVRKEEFCKKYENDYLILTHTGDNIELERILKFIKENPEDVFGIDYKKPVQKEDDEEFINDGKSKNIENFIFIKAIQ